MVKFFLIVALIQIVGVNNTTHAMHKWFASPTPTQQIIKSLETLKRSLKESQNKFGTLGQSLEKLKQLLSKKTNENETALVVHQRQTKLDLDTLEKISKKQGLQIQSAKFALNEEGTMQLIGFEVTKKNGMCHFLMYNKFAQTIIVITIASSVLCYYLLPVLIATADSFYAASHFAQDVKSVIIWSKSLEIIGNVVAKISPTGLFGSFFTKLIIPTTADISPTGLFGSFFTKLIIPTTADISLLKW